MSNSSSGQLGPNAGSGLACDGGGGGGGNALRWTNQNVLIETDISKCGITDDNRIDMSRRNTCPNPPAYRPLVHREAMAALQQQFAAASAATGRVPTIGGSGAAGGRTTLAVKFSRHHQRTNNYLPLLQRPLFIAGQQQSKQMDRSAIGGGVLRDIGNRHTGDRGNGSSNNESDAKCNSSAQTEISAVPEHWRSESHLVGDGGGASIGGAQLCGDSGFYTLPSQYVPPPAPKPGDAHVGK